jgi:hypothetical protein
LRAVRIRFFAFYTKFDTPIRIKSL